MRVLAFVPSMSPYALTMATDDIVHRVSNRVAWRLVSDTRFGGKNKRVSHGDPGGQTITGVWGLGASAP